MKISEVLEIGRYWKVSLASRYWNFSERERWTIAVCMILLGVGIIYSGFWSPLRASAEEAKQAYQREVEFTGWIKSNETLLKKLTKSGGKAQHQPGQSLLSLVTESAQKNQIALTRFEPTNNQGLRIWLEEVPFNQLLSWLVQLNERGAALDTVQLEHGIKLGEVSLTLTLKQ